MLCYVTNNPPPPYQLSDHYVICICSEVDGTPPSSVKKGKRSGGGARGEENETIKSLCEGLGASDWMSRLQAIERLQSMCETNQDLVDGSLVKVGVPCFKYLKLLLLLHVNKE